MEKKFILQKVRNGNKDYRDIYLNNIIEQYQKATGNKKIDLSSVSFREELDSWLNYRNKIGYTYRSLLNYMNLEYSNQMTAELGKGLVDSIVSKNGTTTLITPFTYGLDKKQGNKIIRGNIRYVSKNTKHKSIDQEDSVSFIDSFMTQNPYYQQELDIFEAMHNTGQYDIIVGIFGTNYDKDKDNKIRLLREFKDRLNKNYKEKYIKFNDNYCYTIATKHKVKSNKK